MSTVKILKTRNYIGIGLRHAGDIQQDVDDGIARQLEKQGFVKIMKGTSTEPRVVKDADECLTDSHRTLA